MAVKKKKPNGRRQKFERKRKRRTAHISDECFKWLEPIGGAGFVLELMYDSEDSRRYVEDNVRRYNDAE